MGNSEAGTGEDWREASGRPDVLVWGLCRVSKGWGTGTSDLVSAEITGVYPVTGTGTPVNSGFLNSLPILIPKNMFQCVSTYMYRNVCVLVPSVARV